MKKISLLIFNLLISLLLISCCTSTAQQNNKSNPSNALNNIQKQTNINEFPRSAHYTLVFEKECNGHIYVICTGEGIQSGVFMMHSPNCPCLKEKNYE